MSKKKQPRNGFYYFMLDMQQDLRQQGRFISMRDMPVKAGPLWSKLPDVEKQAYTLRAKQEKATATGPPVTYRRGRMDCTGELLSERRDLVLEAEVRKRREKEHLHSVLSDIDVTKRVFYFIDILSLCEIKDHADERFLPCELALVEYSLSSGILNSMHHFPDPGQIPMGYRFQAQSESSQSHCIPIGFDQANSDYRQIMKAIEQFVYKKGADKNLLMFAKAEAVDRIEWCLQWLADKAGITNRFTEVYEVDMLMVELASRCGATLSTFQAHDMLLTSSYDYELGTRCLWHEQREIKTCSLATVKIYSYILSDYLCPLYQLPLSSNHLPEQHGHTTTITTAAVATAAAGPVRTPILSPPHTLTATGLARGAPSASQPRMPDRQIGGRGMAGRGVGGYTGRGIAVGRGIGRGIGRRTNSAGAL